MLTGYNKYNTKKKKKSNKTTNTPKVSVLRDVSVYMCHVSFSFYFVALDLGTMYAIVKFIPTIRRSGINLVYFFLFSTSEQWFM